MEIILASDTSISTLRISFWLWARVLVSLRHRSRNRTESGAFLLGLNGDPSARVTAFMCYDEVDPEAYQRGAIAFHAIGYARLWQYCRGHNLRVLADVHTHPGVNVRQSSIDQRNPMMPMAGHVALIVPKYGRSPWWSLEGVGVYEYLGDFKWRTHRLSHRPKRIKLSLW